MKLESLHLPKAKLTQLQKKGLETVEDLMMFFPRKYYDFTHVTPVKEVQDGQICAVVGEVKEVKVFGKMVRAKIKDDENQIMSIIWFNQPFIAKFLKDGDTYMFCGKTSIDEKYNSKQMTNPFYFDRDLQKYRRMVPVYPKIKGMSEDYLHQLIASSLAVGDKSDPVERGIIEKFSLMKKGQAYKVIHNPKSEGELNHAHERFLFDDLFEFAMQMEAMHEGTKRTPYVMPKCEDIKRFVGTLPFELTEGQRNALNTIYIKMRRGERVHSLIQGDVGCGKTIVAITLMMIASENGFQSAMIAPTGVLAKQHYEDLSQKAGKLGYKVVYLSGDMKVREKKKVLEQIRTGEAQMVVGTHAVLSKDVQFNNLSLSIVDEEHRFGVVQRNQLREKAKQGVHHVSMSATPIPRTIALTMYGDAVEVLTIKTLPKGRKPIKTVHLTNEVEVWEGLYRQIKDGRQCYVVCPLIEDSGSDSLQDVDSVEATHEKMTDYFKRYPEVNIGMVSGKMKPEEINEGIQGFSENKAQILISTTIIEVGVNVPNATVIVIKNAERFGLAQLHQLRGRVGRGNHASFCVLLSNKKDNPKLQVMRTTNDGFKVAEQDLALRGTGDLIGTKQTGQNKYIMSMLANLPFYELIKEEVKEIYADPKRLSHYRFLDILDYEDISV